ncbi:unannotated protein [freshwater metagenome]|uniref:Unannotated protein n=1 Tax=freshwater metagenome TaxID=449393 RepID=A0A6J7RHH1_9ZZZZ
MLHAEEEQAHIRPTGPQLVDGADEGERIEPVVDATAPQDDLVVEADARHNALDRRSGLARHLIGDAERRERDELFEAGAVVVVRGVDATDGRHLTEPEVALLVARAEEVVTTGELLVQHQHRGQNRVAAILLAEVARLLELFKVEGVVDVDHDDLVRGGHHRVLVHDVALEHDDVGPGFGLGHARRVDDAGDEIGVVQLAVHRRQQLHVMLSTQRQRDLPRSNGRAGHARGEAVTGDHEHLAPGRERALDVEGLHDCVEAAGELGLGDVGMHR